MQQVDFAYEDADFSYRFTGDLDTAFSVLGRLRPEYTITADKGLVIDAEPVAPRFKLFDSVKVVSDPCFCRVGETGTVTFVDEHGDCDVTFDSDGDTALYFADELEPYVYPAYVPETKVPEVTKRYVRVTDDCYDQEVRGLIGHVVKDASGPHDRALVKFPGWNEGHSEDDACWYVFSKHLEDVDIDQTATQEDAGDAAEPVELKVGDIVRCVRKDFKQNGKAGRVIGTPGYYLDCLFTPSLASDGYFLADELELLYRPTGNEPEPVKVEGRAFCVGDIVKLSDKAWHNPGTYAVVTHDDGGDGRCPFAVFSEEHGEYTYQYTVDMELIYRP